MGFSLGGGIVMLVALDIVMSGDGWMFILYMGGQLCVGGEEFCLVV